MQSRTQWWSQAGCQNQLWCQGPSLCTLCPCKAVVTVSYSLVSVVFPSTLELDPLCAVLGSQLTWPDLRPQTLVLSLSTFITWMARESLFVSSSLTEGRCSLTVISVAIIKHHCPQSPLGGRKGLFALQVTSSRRIEELKQRP